MGFQLVDDEISGVTVKLFQLAAYRAVRVSESWPRRNSWTSLWGWGRMTGAGFLVDVDRGLERGWRKVQNEGSGYGTLTWKEQGQERRIVTRHSQGKVFSSSAFRHPTGGGEVGFAMKSSEEWIVSGLPYPDRRPILGW